MRVSCTALIDCDTMTMTRSNFLHKHWVLCVTSKLKEILMRIHPATNVSEKSVENMITELLDNVENLLSHTATVHNSSRIDELAQPLFVSIPRPIFGWISI